MGLNFTTGRLTMRYPVIFEGTPTGGFSAYVPDLPGCVAAGETMDRARALIEGAIAMHLHGMREDGIAIPEPSNAEFIEVS
jgi:predicted RNase H-like HicB family nuclease